MLQEALLWLAAQCHPTARRMGFLRASIGLQSRHRRCREAWAPHLHRSRDCLEQSALQAPGDGTALVLGSGLLLDVPIEALSRHFREVLLVDVVHLPQVRWQVRGMRNVRLLEADLTGCIEALQAGASAPVAVEAATSAVRALGAPQLRWVASVNLLSQLHLLPVEWMQRRWPALSPRALEQWARGVERAHLEGVRALGVPGCVLADIEQFTRDAAGELIDYTDFSSVLDSLGAPDREWLWALAHRANCEAAPAASTWGVVPPR